MSVNLICFIVKKRQTLQQITQLFQLTVLVYINMANYFLNKITFFYIPNRIHAECRSCYFISAILHTSRHYVVPVSNLQTTFPQLTTSPADPIGWTRTNASEASALTEGFPTLLLISQFIIVIVLFSMLRKSQCNRNTHM